MKSSAIVGIVVMASALSGGCASVSRVGAKAAADRAEIAAVDAEDAARRAETLGDVATELANVDKRVDSLEQEVKAAPKPEKEFEIDVDAQFEKVKAQLPPSLVAGDLAPLKTSLVEFAQEAEKEVNEANAEKQQAEVQAEAAKEEVGQAKKAAEVAQDKEEEAETNEAKVKAGKLIRYGITAGVGPAVHLPMHEFGRGSSTPAVGSLAYLMFHPAYWQKAPQENIYCANLFVGSVSSAAFRAADAEAMSQAENMRDKLLELVRNSPHASFDEVGKEWRGYVPSRRGYVPSRRGVKVELSKAQFAAALSIVRAEAAGEKNVRRTNKGTDPVDITIDQAKKALATSLQQQVARWHGTATNCGARRFVGFWMGYPTNFTTTLPVQVEGPDTDTVRQRLDVKGLVSFGYGISPNAYVSILAGVAFGLANLDPADDDDETVITGIISIGGNLDLLLLLGKV